jgi:hypothetical protein
VTVGSGYWEPVDLSGIVSRVAGTCRQGYSGDGGQATKAQLSGLVGNALDGAGNLFIAADDRIREVSVEGIITTWRVAAARPLVMAGRRDVILLSVCVSRDCLPLRTTLRA